MILGPPIGLAQAEAPTLAVVSAVGKHQVDRRYLGQLETVLANGDSVRLVERAEIDRILAEQTLSISGIMPSGSNAVRLGRLLQASLILTVDEVPTEIGSVRQARIIETESGIILSSWPLGAELIEAERAQLRRRVEQAVAKSRRDRGSLRYVGILQIRSEEPGTLLDGLGKLLEAYLTEVLADSPDVVILEREQLQHLQREADLTAGELALRSAAILIDGGIRYTEGQAGLIVTLDLRPQDPAAAVRSVTMQWPVSDDDPTKRLQEITDRVRAGLEIAPGMEGQRDMQTEASLFLDQVPLLLAGGRYDEAVCKAEVALVLKPGQKTRYWASRAWYQWAVSLRQQMNGYPNARIRRGRRDPPGRAMEPQTERNMRTSDRQAPSQPDSDKAAEQQRLQQMLRAYIRSYSLLRDLTRWHLADPPQARIPDPTAGLFGYDPNAELQHRMRLSATVATQTEPQAEALLDQLWAINLDVIRMQRNYYLDLYDQDQAAADGYWETWLRLKGLLYDLGGYNPHGIADFTADVFAAFENLSAGDDETRLSGIRPLISFQAGRNVTPEESALYNELTRSADPWTRLLANRLMIRTNFLKYSRAVMRIFHDEILPEQEVWSFEDAGLVPEYLRTAIHRLAVSDPQALIKYFAPVNAALLRPENLRHLLAWNVRDCFWPYLNSWQRESQTEDVAGIAAGLAGRLDGGDLALAYDDQQNANILRLQVEIKLVELGQKEKVDPRLWTFDHYVGNTEYVRLRPEIEAPSRSGPLDLSLFDDWETQPMVGQGSRTRTTSRSSDVATRDGAFGMASYQGQTHTLDVEGNETIRVFDQTAEAELTKEKQAPTSAWQDYSIEKYPIRLASAAGPVRRSERIRYPRDVMQPSRFYGDNEIFVAQEIHEEGKVRINVYRHAPQLSATILRVGSTKIPGVKEDTAAVTATTADEENFYVGTAHGLLIFSRTVGTPVTERERAAIVMGLSSPRAARADLPEPRTDHTQIQAKHITEGHGLPGNRILSMASVDGRLYVGLGPIGNTGGDCGLVVYHPDKENYDVLASSRARDVRNPFDQANFYQIDRMLPDPDGDSLWLAVNGNPDLNGIWRYKTSTGEFTQAANETSDVIDMQWSDGAILYGLMGSGLTRYDPRTGQKTWLLGYVPSKFSGPQPPAAPPGTDGGPAYGFARTRLWPFAMSGDDLFTIGWQPQDVLLHRRGLPPAVKTIFDPDAGVITGKSDLRTTAAGVLLVQLDGGTFRFHRKEVSE